MYQSMHTQLHFSHLLLFRESSFISLKIQHCLDIYRSCMTDFCDSKKASANAAPRKFLLPLLVLIIIIQTISIWSWIIIISNTALCRKSSRCGTCGVPRCVPMDRLTICLTPSRNFSLCTITKYFPLKNLKAACITRWQAKQGHPWNPNNSWFIFGTLFIDNIISDKIVNTIKKIKILKKGMNEDLRLLKQVKIFFSYRMQKKRL